MENQAEAINLSVKVLKGDSFTINTTASMNISTVIEIIHEKTGMPIDKIRLLYLGRVLLPEKKLSDYNIKSNASIYVVEKKPVCSLF